MNEEEREEKRKNKKTQEKETGKKRGENTWKKKIVLGESNLGLSAWKTTTLTKP